MGNVTSIIKTLTGDVQGARKDALRKETKTHIIDTCMCVDTGQWETGIKPKDNIGLLSNNTKEEFQPW